MIETDQDITVTATNTQKEKIQVYHDLILKKEVTGRYETAEDGYLFYLEFSGLNPSEEYMLSNGSAFTAETDGTADVQVALKKDETITINDLPENCTYTVTEEAGDYISSYEIAGNEVRKDKGNSDKKKELLSTMEETLDAEETVTFVNRLEKTQNLVLQKKVQTKRGDDIKNDTSSYELAVALGNLDPYEKIITSIGPFAADDDGTLEFSIYLKNQEKITFYDLPVGTTYQITEPANDKTASFEITDANGGTNIVLPEKANTVENKDLVTEVETVNENEEAVVVFTNKVFIPGSIKLIKKDGSLLLAGVTFALCDADGNVLEEKTTDGSGEVLFEDLDPAVYLVKKTKTAPGHTLLSSPLIVDLPFVLPASNAAGIDTSKAIYSTRDNSYLFYDVTYTVTNEGTLTLPRTGDPKAYLFMGLWIFAGLGILLYSRKKYME